MRQMHMHTYTLTLLSRRFARPTMQQRYVSQSLLLCVTMFLYIAALQLGGTDELGLLNVNLRASVRMEAASTRYLPDQRAMY